MAPARIIGLTGGIATGKTTVAAYLAAAYGLPILDADLYARAAVAPGSEGLAKIRDRYGPELLLADGSLDRQRLGEIVFNDLQERQWLEAQIHPQVRDRLQRDAEKLSQAAVIVMVIPLLFEAEMTDLVTEIWVVTCREDQQRQRLIQRNHLTLEQAMARINSQMTLAEKITQAAIVLDNSGSLAALQQQIDRAMQAGEKLS